MQRIFFTTNVLSGDNLLFSLTAILCEVILFCRHDLRRKTLHVSDASKVAKTKNCCEPNSVFCHSANRALVQWCSMTKSFINPSLGNFAQKMRFEPSRAVFWSLSCYKKPKLTIKPFTGCTLHGLLIQMQNISLQILGMRRKQNFDTAVTVKVFTAYCCYTVTQQSSLLLFTFSPLLFFRFSGQLNFFFCWAFSRLHFGGKGF